MLSLEFQRTIIYRPGVLITPEGRDEIRALEWVFQKVLSVFDWGPFFSIPTKRLAKAMVNIALNNDEWRKDTISADSSKNLEQILDNKEIFDSAV